MILIKSMETFIWGRSFTLPVEYCCYKGETVTDKQIAAIDAFPTHMDWVEKAKNMVEAYCKEQVMEDEENTKKDNIFSYVKPMCLYITREENHPRIALMCKYRYDPEHGLAVVFSHDGHVDIGAQDIVL